MPIKRVNCQSIDYLLWSKIMYWIKFSPSGIWHKVKMMLHFCQNLAQDAVFKSFDHTKKGLLIFSHGAAKILPIHTSALNNNIQSIPVFHSNHTSNKKSSANRAWNGYILIPALSTDIYTTKSTTPWTPPAFHNFESKGQAVFF